MNVLVSNQMVTAAFDWLDDHAAPAAAAKAELIRAEHNVKRVKARLFLASNETSVAAKDAWAMSQDEYGGACEREAEAARNDEYHRREREKCQALIEAWRTESANYRTMTKVG